MEPIVPPQPGNATGPPSRPSRKHHIILVVVAVLVGILYLAGNVWLYVRMRKKQRAAVPEAIQQFVEQGAPSQIATLTPSPTPVSTSTPPAKQDPAPRDTPRPTGPGPFACAPDGTCNRYGEDARKQYCTVTFADSLCLDQCGDASKRCKK